MGSSRYDEALIQILQAEGKIMPFLDVIFGFLYRRTDFYHEHSQPSAMGFPPGVAEQLVATTFRKWHLVHQRSSVTASPATAAKHDMKSPPGAGEVVVPPPAAEEVVVSTPAAKEFADTGPVVASSSGDRSGQPLQMSPPSELLLNSDSSAQSRSGGGGGATENAADSYNGAVCDGYSWSQTITDLTVRVPVPPDIRRAKQVSVALKTDRVCVRLVGGAELVSGRLHRPIQAEESYWSLLPGDCVQLSLEKARECWWTSLLDQEPDIDIRQIEAVKPWEDLSEEEQMKVNELRAKEEAKRQPAGHASSVTSGGKTKDVSALLREAWHAEGSPFRGQPYDPAAVQILPGAADTGAGS